MPRRSRGGSANKALQRTPLRGSLNLVVSRRRQMSNEAYLIATDVPGPCIGNIGQDKKSVLLANAPLAVPVYWISLFDSSHLVRLEVPGEEGPVEIPSLAAEMGDAKRLLGEHHEILATTFPEFEPTWDRFASVVRRLKKPHIKIELSEIWDIDQIEPDDFARFAKGELERLSKTLGVDQIELPDLPDWQAGGSHRGLSRHFAGSRRDPRKISPTCWRLQASRAMTEPSGHFRELPRRSRALTT